MRESEAWLLLKEKIVLVGSDQTAPNAGYWRNGLCNGINEFLDDHRSVVSYDIYEQMRYRLKTALYAGMTLGRKRIYLDDDVTPDGYTVTFGDYIKENDPELFRQHRIDYCTKFAQEAKAEEDAADSAATNTQDDAEIRAILSDVVKG